MTINVVGIAPQPRGASRSPLLCLFYPVYAMVQTVVFCGESEKLPPHDRAVRTHHRTGAGVVYAEVNSHYPLLLDFRIIEFDLFFETEVQAPDLSSPTESRDTLLAVRTTPGYVVHITFAKRDVHPVPGVAYPNFYTRGVCTRTNKSIVPVHRREAEACLRLSGGPALPAALLPITVVRYPGTVLAESLGYRRTAEVTGKLVELCGKIIRNVGTFCSRDSQRFDSVHGLRTGTAFTYEIRPGPHHANEKIHSLTIQFHCMREGSVSFSQPDFIC